MAGNSRFDLSNIVAFQNAVVITPTDVGTGFEGPLHIVCFDGSSVRITLMDGTVVDHPVVAGIMLPVLVKKVHGTGTNATKVVGYW